MIAVVIPCYRVAEPVLDVLARVGPECGAIFVVDDGCPERTGDRVEAEWNDPRVTVLRHDRNRGVGAAVVTGYRAALEAGATVIVKLDGDGQMDPELVPRLVAPILAGEADYAKGNRFFELDGLAAMPKLRLFGNAALSLLSKASSGYWNVNDPTNGFTAVHAAVARRLPLDKLAEGWFFESDVLFRLGVMRAVVADVPMTAVYGDEHSNLRVSRVIGTFLGRHVVNGAKRFAYAYFVRDFNVASIEVLAAAGFLAFGGWFGVTRWIEGARRNAPSTSGTVMLAGLPIIVGVQLLLAALTYDVQNVPRDVLHKRLEPAT